MIERTYAGIVARLALQAPAPLTESEVEYLVRAHDDATEERAGCPDAMHHRLLTTLAFAAIGEPTV